MAQDQQDDEVAKKSCKKRSFDIAFLAGKEQQQQSHLRSNSAFSKYNKTDADARFSKISKVIFQLRSVHFQSWPLLLQTAISLEHNFFDCRRIFNLFFVPASCDLGQGNLRSGTFQRCTTLDTKLDVFFVGD